MTGQIIRDLCRQRGYSQKDLADKMGVTQTVVSRWCCGSDLQLSTLKRLAAALRTDLNTLGGWNGQGKL
jgi:transcriptional regulator with XRE-family HTH domain